MITVLYLITLFILSICCIVSAVAWVKYHNNAQTNSGFITVCLFSTWIIIFSCTISHLESESTTNCIQEQQK